MAVLLNAGQFTSTATISGQIFQDFDGDGVKDSGDTGLSGWIIFLDTNGDGFRQADETAFLTDSNGNYTFSGLAAGTYRVREVVQGGWKQTTANPANTVLSASGSTASGITFGNFKFITILGTVSNDLQISDYRVDPHFVLPKHF